MINSIAFDREIDIYWDKIFHIDEELYFEIYLNGKKVGTTEFTHYEFLFLTPETNYEINVVALVKGSLEVYKEYEKITVQTGREKNRLNIALPPYDAVGDGQTDVTKALQAALDDCTANDCVYIPAGVFVIGSVDVHSDTEIYIEKDGVLLGSAKREAYLPKRISRFEGYELERYSAMINAGKIDNACKINCKNVVIRGEGEIRGGGLALANDVIDYELQALKADIERLGELLKTYDRVEVIPGRLRPFLIDVNNCENFILHGLKVGYGACWNVHYCYSKNVVVSSCIIRSEVREGEKAIGIWNGDGIDPDSSLNSVIYDITFDTHDDAIAIKSGKNPEGNVIGVPCKDLRIFHTRGRHGIALGSELSGGIENVYIWDVHIKHSSRGIRVKTTVERGGYVRNLVVSNCKTPALSIDTLYNCNRDGEVAGTYTQLENFYYENVEVMGNCELPFPGITFYGFDKPEHYIKNISLKNFTIHGKGSTLSQEMKVDNVRGISITNLKVSAIEE